MEEEKPTGKRRGSPLLEGMKTGERGLQQVLEGESALCLQVTAPEWTSAPAYLGYRQGTGICSGSSRLPFPETLTRTLWHSHTQKSNLIIDTVIPWIPSLATANGWCTNDSIRTLIGPL